jgi:hypothetical protein
MLPDLGPADRIGEFWATRRAVAFAELLIDSSGECSSGCCGRLKC